MSSAVAPSSATTTTHIDIHDHVARQRWAELLGVSEQRLRKAVRIVGPRVSSVSAYLAT